MRISDWSSDVCSSDLGKRRSKMIPFFNRQFREFMKCPVCDAQIRLRRSTAPRFFIAEMLMCLRCGHDHHFPLTWLFSRASDASEASSQIGRVSCRERVCLYVSISGVAVSLTKKKKEKQSVSN